VAGYFEELQVRLSSLTSLHTNFSNKKIRLLVNQKVSFMETTFIRLESLTYFGSGYAGLEMIRYAFGAV